MYEYLNRFVKDWKDEELLAVLSKLPEHELIGSTWAKIIAAVGVDGFVRLALTLPNTDVKIPSLFSILTVLSAECIVEKSKTMSITDAKQAVLGKLELKEVDDLVDKLRSTTTATKTNTDTESGLST